MQVIAPGGDINSGLNLNESTLFWARNSIERMEILLNLEAV